MHAHFLGEYIIVCTFSYAPFHSPSFTGRIRPRQEGQESENGMYTMAPVLLLPLIVSQPYIVPIPSFSRLFLAQGTWEGKCILDWTPGDVQDWLLSNQWNYFRALGDPSGISLAQCNHKLMLDVIKGPKSTHIFNAVGELIDVDISKYSDRVDALQRCISRRGKALSFPHTSVLPRAVSALLQHSQGR